MVFEEIEIYFQYEAVYLHQLEYLRRRRSRGSQERRGPRGEDVEVVVRKTKPLLQRVWDSMGSGADESPWGVRGGACCLGTLLRFIPSALLRWEL